MRPYEFKNFSQVLEQASYQLQYRSRIVHSQHWQGVDIASKPEMATHEVAHVSFAVPLDGFDFDLEAYAADIRPNLPWADNHFDERVCGYPINPGTEWENWPYGKSAATFLDDRGMFNHNYMERYWPKQAGRVKVPTKSAADYIETVIDEKYMGARVHRGIMYEYGDLKDVVKLLAADPYTRQAYLPVWFPEDTGGGSKRAPCTIGYHFLMRDGKLDVNYHIRSCDFVRHFRDDLYLTVRLLLWVIQQCREVDPRWIAVTPGKFLMQIGSLHIFRNDFTMLFGKR